jgi:hypothetical protein
MTLLEALEHALTCPLAQSCRVIGGNDPESINACLECRDMLILLRDANDNVPLPQPVRDIYNFEHDMVRGPCACGAWHGSPAEYFGRLMESCKPIVEAYTKALQRKES